MSTKSTPRKSKVEASLVTDSSKNLSNQQAQFPEIKESSGWFGSNPTVMKAHTWWSHGDWDSLTQLSQETIENSQTPILGLYVASGYFQKGKENEGLRLIKWAVGRGVDPQLVLRFLISGTYSSLAKAAYVTGLDKERVDGLLSEAITTGAPFEAQELLIENRLSFEVPKLPEPLGKNDEKPTLKQLYNIHDGYVSDKWDRYLFEYDRLFLPFRDTEVRLLEIGVQNGGSLEIWGTYFPQAKAIVGCDINTKCGDLTYRNSKISVLVGDATTVETKEQIRKISEGFDIVIDDGSHINDDIIKAFVHYFPLVTEGGLFIAEDLHTAYWRQYKGGLEQPQNAMKFFQALTDVINHEHWQTSKTRQEFLKDLGFDWDIPDSLLWEIHSVEFINSLCVIRRKSIDENELGLRRIVGDEQVVASLYDRKNTRSVRP